MNILVTGGTGYIGGHLVKRLNDEGHNVHVIDHERNNSMIVRHENVTYHKMDLFDIKKVRKKFININIDIVFHLASNIDVNESEKEKYQYFRNNVLCSQLLFEFMKSKGIKKLVFVSTCAVYGRVVNNPINEDHAKDPESYYGKTKNDVEEIIKKSHFDYVILRLFNVVGSDGVDGENHKKETHLIPHIVEQVEKGKPVVVRGYGVNTNDGYCERDYIHVVDVVDALVRAKHLLNNGGGREIFNIGSGLPISVIHVLKEVALAFNKDIYIEHGEIGVDVPSVYADIEKAYKRLGWRVTKTLKDMINDHLKWIREEKNGI